MIARILKTAARWMIASPVIYLAIGLGFLALYAFILLSGGVVGYAYETMFGSSRESMPKSHLTIYVNEPLLTDGGAVIVAGIPLPEQAWRALADAPNPADNDPANPKRAEVREGDRLFGAIVTSPVSYVELLYPEGGSFTFNFRTQDEGRDKLLQTTQIGVGSGPGRTDQKTGKPVKWEDVTTIHIFGKSNDESWTRFARAMPGLPLDDPEIRESRFAGATVFSLTEPMIAKYMAQPK